MKANIRLLLPIAIIAALFSACDEPDVWNKVPAAVSQFVQKYWPGQDLSYATTEKDGGTQVTIQNGPTIEFDTNGSWTSIKGNGSTIPSMLLYDQLPDPLYRYIEQSEATNGVYNLSRTSTIYEVTLLNTVITYTISTSQITIPTH